MIRPMVLSALRKQLAEATWWRGDHGRVVFRDADGNMHEISKVKVFAEGVVICEREDD